VSWASGGVSSRRVALSLAAIPFAMLAAMYVWLAVAHGTWDLLPVVVHESGRYTLLGTVLYFSHFLREIPVDVAMAFAISASALSLWTPAPRGDATRRRLIMACAATALAIAVIGFVGAAAVHGAASARLDLLQFRTRDDEVAAGSHWNYHLLSTLWFLLGALPVLRLTMAAAGLATRPAELRGRRVARALAWGYVTALCLVFGISSLAWTSSRYAGHQARELLTHVPVTLMLTAAALAALAGPPAFERDTRGAGTRILDALRRDAASWIACVLLAAFLAWRALSGDVLAEGQSSLGLPAMVGGHFFEHALDYVLTPLVAVVAVLLTASHGRQRISRS
jgi:hypothetical protein